MKRFGCELQQIYWAIGKILLSFLSSISHLTHSPFPSTRLLNLQRLKFNPGWFQSIVEDTAQCGAECADPLLFLGTDLLPQLIPLFPTVPRLLPLLVLLRISLYFSTISLQIPFSGLVACTSLLFPDILKEGGGPLGVDM